MLLTFTFLKLRNIVRTVPTPCQTIELTLSLLFAVVPSKLETHLENSIADLDYIPIPNAPALTLDNVNFHNVANFYVTSKNGDLEGTEDWLISNYGIPSRNGTSAAPVHIIAVDKSDIVGAGYVDVSIGI